MQQLPFSHELNIKSIYLLGNITDASKEIYLNRVKRVEQNIHQRMLLNILCLTSIQGQWGAVEVQEPPGIRGPGLQESTWRPLAPSIQGQGVFTWGSGPIRQGGGKHIQGHERNEIVVKLYHQ